MPPDEPQPAPRPDRDADERKPTPAEERGERIETGKTIARGGKQDGPVPGAESAPRQPED